MAHLVRPWIVRPGDAAGRRVKKGTPDSRKVRERARLWYGQGLCNLPPRKRVPLASDKKVARAMLAELEAKAQRGRVGLIDPDQLRRPLLEHLADFEAHLRAGGPTGRGSTEKQVKQKVGLVRRVVEGCRFRTIADVNAEQVEQFLARLKARGKALVPPSPAKEWYTRGELAALLGVAPATVPALVRRRGLAAAGNGKARRFPRTTAEALHARAARGVGTQTANYYLREMK